MAEISKAEPKPAGGSGIEASPSVARKDAAPPKPAQAVVIVHGMGEQRPMDTIRGFVKAVWSKDLSRTEGTFGKRTDDPDEANAHINKTWIKPDARTKSFELRRITTPKDKAGRRTDFYELYWADVTQGTTLGRLKGWMKGLLLRKLSDVPSDALKLYFAAWIAVLVILAPAAVSAYMKWKGLEDFLVPGWLWTLLGGAMAALVTGFLLPYFGDVAIYVQAAPDTVGKRAEVRERGLALMKELMDSSDYDRVVLVAHSLGTIVAYDLLQILWAEYGPGLTNPRQEPEVLKALGAVGKFALPIESKKRAEHTMSDAERDDLRKLQWKTYTLLREASAKGKAWKISDFVTCGSPLTHAEFLVTRNAGDFKRSVEERLVATCPPVSERKTPTIVFKTEGNIHPHQGSVFAATRWTNIFDRGNGWLTGDPISGPLLENYGPGVEDLQVRLKSGLGRIFTHTHYWSLTTKGQEVLPSGGVGRTHLEVLRDAVDLGRKLEPNLEAPESADDEAESDDDAALTIR